MNSDLENENRRRIRSPRSAAIAGIIFSLLMSTGLLLMFNIATATPADINREWLESWSRTAFLVLIMVPFAGIAFLWFTGVIRDLIGDREDRFFATIYFGSSILLVAMLFVWGAILGAIFGTYAAALLIPVIDDIIIFGFVFMNQIIDIYFLRMAGVYMLAINSLWARADVMPRWLTIITYIVALGFLLFAGTFRELRFLFPGWVFVVSVYILILNYRQRSNAD